MISDRLVNDVGFIARNHNPYERLTLVGITIIFVKVHMQMSICI
jgi:hypothetical protein